MFVSTLTELSILFALLLCLPFVVFGFIAFVLFLPTQKPPHFHPTGNTAESSHCCE